MLESSNSVDPVAQELQRISQLIGGNQLPEAAQALNQVQHRAPRDPRVRLLGMRLADKAGNTDGAITLARQALALAPDWHVAQVELALLLAHRGEAAEALKLARQALLNAPDNARVMTSVINVAVYADDHEQTMAWAEEAIQRFPDEMNMRVFLGRYLAYVERHADAIPHFEVVLDRIPGHYDALKGLAESALAEGTQDKARIAADRLQALFPTDPETQYLHAIANGQTPSTLPADVVASRFDVGASKFDAHLVRGLQYRLPERVAQLLLTLHPDRRFNLLDLGCGTGLVGLYLGPIEGFIIGADLSEKMIEQAARHGVYAKFYKVNVLDALRETPDAHYEAITATDVLVYIGDLSPVIPNALRILKPGGHFIFSCEAAAADEPDLILRPATERYAHKATDVERRCREAGFSEVLIENLPSLRLEGGQPVPGFLVTARKPLAA